jgi:hypothetical protein
MVSANMAVGSTIKLFDASRYDGDIAEKLKEYN